jgi:hypothetical protein
MAGTMRRCRNPGCGQYFTPQKDFYVYCCWQCRVAHVGEHYEDRRGWQRERDNAYDRGYRDGLRAGPMNHSVPPGIWKALASLAHPDKWQDSPAMLALCHEAMIWLNQHRPKDSR